MNKWVLPIALILLAVSLSSPELAHADSIKRANPGDITKLLKTACELNSAYSAALIGESRGRIYVEYVTAIHSGSLFSNDPKLVVYWLLRSEISEQQLMQLNTCKRMNG